MATSAAKVHRILAAAHEERRRAYKSGRIKTSYRPGAGYITLHSAGYELAQGRDAYAGRLILQWYDRTSTFATPEQICARRDQHLAAIVAALTAAGIPAECVVAEGAWRGSQVPMVIVE